jgi:hypothetical protein
VKSSRASPFRSGPWPGLTPRGAGLLLACAAFLAVGQVLIGPLTRPLPDVVVLGVTTLMPLAIAERIIRAPGAATAVCGAYLLPRATLSLLVPTIPPPPLLLVPALAFDLGLWLDMSHVGAIADLLPRRLRIWRTPRKSSPTAQFSRSRALAAGAIFGVVLSLVEPAYQVFLGADARVWSAPSVWIAGAVTTLVCAGLATLVTVQPTTKR